MIPFVHNDTSLIGFYYILDHDEYTDVIVGPEPEIPGMQGAILSGHASAIIEPVMLKIHSAPFSQQVDIGADPETGLPTLHETLLVFVTDRDSNLYLVHWNSTGCFRDWTEALRYREEHFDRLKRKQILDYGGASSPDGKRYIQQLAAFEDKKNKDLEEARRKKASQSTVNIEDVKRQVKALEDIAAGISGIPSSSLFKPGK